MKKAALFVAFMSLLMVAQVSFAESQHGKSGSKTRAAMKMPSMDVFADGLHLTFMVMKNENHKTMLKNMKMNEVIEPGTTHNVMVLIKDEKTGKEFASLPVVIKVTDGNDNEQTKTGSYKEMMKTYDSYFVLREKGKYHIKVLFETGGQARSIGTSYELT